MSWTKYFEDLGRTAPSEMEDSNDCVQAPSLGAAIGMSGRVAGCRCLDAGRAPKRLQFVTQKQPRHAR